MKKLIRNTKAEEAAIQAAIATDPDTWEVSTADLARAQRGRPPLPQTKIAVSIRFDKDVLDALKAGGKGWQSRANALLRRALHLGPNS